MKARRKGDTTPFDDVYQIVIGRGLNAKYIPINDVEFEQEQEPTSDHWQEVRERVAIAITPQCLKLVQDVLFGGGAISEETIAKQVAFNTIEIADELVKKLKGE